MMSSVQELIHKYASEYYDPAEAHEYYMENRELKGRKKGKGKDSSTAKSGRRNDSDPNSGRRKAESTALSDAHKATVAQLRSVAVARRTAISNTLKTLLTSFSEEDKGKKESLLTTRRQELEGIARKLENDIKKVPTVPDSAKGANREFLLKKRADKLAALRGEAKTKSDAASSKTKADFDKLVTDSRNRRHSALVNTQNQRTAVAEDLRASLNSARARYNAAKKALTLKHKVALDAEDKPKKKSKDRKKAISRKDQNGSRNEV